ELLPCNQLILGPAVTQLLYQQKRAQFVLQRPRLPVLVYTLRVRVVAATFKTKALLTKLLTSASSPLPRAQWVRLLKELRAKVQIYWICATVAIQIYSVFQVLELQLYRVDNILAMRTRPILKRPMFPVGLQDHSRLLPEATEVAVLPMEV